MISIKILLQGSLVFILGFAACNNDNATVTAPDTVTTTDTHAAKQLPVFKMTDKSGNMVDLTSFQGKKVFVNLWATWCPPCRREMPSIQKLYKSIDTSKVAFVMLALDDAFDKSKNYMVQQKLDMPLYYPAENMPEMFNVPGIPTTFIFNEQGQLIDKIEGSDDYDSDKYRKMLK